MTTAADLIEETRRYLFAGQREQLNLLNGSHSAATTTFTFTHDLNQIKAGAYISVELEILYVWDTNEAAKTATVQRGMLGSTAATHVDTTLCFVNSKFPTFNIFQALNADLNDLWAPGNGLYGISFVEINYNPAVAAYDLTNVSGIIDVLRVRSKQPGPTKNWYEVRNWAYKRNADTGVFPSGNSITLYRAGWPGLPFQVIYSQPFIPLASLTSNVVTDSLLPASAVDIPALGAAMRLAGVRETQRNFNESQGDTRRAGEVPPGAQTGGMKVLAALRQQRIKSEADKLSSSYPTRRQG